MAIDSLRDGFVKMCFDPSANVVGYKCNVVLEGAMLATGTATPDTLIKVTSTRDIDTVFGAGSVIAESLKVAMGCCGNSGVQFYAVPRADTGTPAEYTLTVTGPATSDGRIDLYGADAKWNTSTHVTSGDTANTIAAAIQADIPADFPFTATVAANVITLTAKNGGTSGNNLNMMVNWHGRNNYMPDGVTVTFAQTVTGTGAPAAIDYNALLGECCVCAYALLYDDTTLQRALQLYLEDKWACDAPQCFGHGYVYNSGSLGTILATDTNAAVLSRLSHGVGDPNLGWLKVAAYAAQSACSTIDNPEISIQGPTYGVLSCLRAPATCSAYFTYDERTQLQDAGFVTTVPVHGGTGSLTSPQIVNDVTNNRYDSEGRLNLTFQSTASRRLATSTAIAIAEQLQQFNGLGYYTAGTNVREGAVGATKNMMLGYMRAWAKSQVGSLFSEFENLEQDLTFTDDFEVAPACQGVPGKLYMNLVYRPPVRIREISVNAKPVLMDNCNN